MRASQVEHLNDKLKAHPDDSDLLVEREFVDEICEAHAKPGEAAYDSSHDMALTGDQERNQMNGIIIQIKMCNCEFPKQLHHYLEDLAEPCNEMILRCSFEGYERKCSDLFYPQVGKENCESSWRQKKSGRAPIVSDN